VKAWLKKHTRFHMHFTPTSSSWMNLIERFFADLTNDCIREGSFQSVKDLIAAIEDYLAARNENPKRYVWRATGEEILRKIARAREVLATIIPSYFNYMTLVRPRSDCSIKAPRRQSRIGPPRQRRRLTRS
jgi:hypothetical protein